MPRDYQCKTICIYVVKSYITLTIKNTPLKDDKPGKDWCISFEKRWNVVLGKRKPELLTKARATDLSLKTLIDFLSNTRRH